MRSAAAARIEGEPQQRKLAPALRELMGTKPQRTYARELGIAVSRLNEVLKKRRRGFSARDAVKVHRATGLDLQLCLGVR